MAATIDPPAYDDLSRDPATVIAQLRDELAAGAAWYPALLEAIKRWRAPHELVDGRHYYYLIGGEAFDWLLLAERLLDAVANQVPEAEREALLFYNEPPAGSPVEFKPAIGATKHHAHLNFVYGVTVEQALQLSYEEDLQKELRCRAWGQDGRADEGIFERIYSKRREELLALFREQRKLPHADALTFTELKEFTYWLFKYRVAQCDPAKVASDTQRGLNTLARLHGRRHPAPAPLEEPEPADVIDVAL